MTIWNLKNSVFAAVAVAALLTVIPVNISGGMRRDSVIVRFLKIVLGGIKP